MNAFEKKIADSLASCSLASGDGIVLAVSGGADSTALMHAMSVLKKEGLFTGDILCVHVNHCLRAEESDADQKFIVELAGRMGFAAVTEKVDVKGYAGQNAISIETAARELRMSVLAAEARQRGYKWIVTAHHADDNAETLVQRLSRGTGLRGLCGIWPEKKFQNGISFIRPMLSVRRHEIITYLQQAGLVWREDATNAQCCYRRNFIRHKLLPALEKESSGRIVEKLNTLSAACRKLMEKVSKEADAYCCGGISIDIDGERVVLLTDGLQRLHREVAVEIIRRAIEKSGCRQRAISSEHYQRIMELVECGQSGREVELTDGYVAVCDYSRLLFFKRKYEKPIANNFADSITLTIPGRTVFGKYTIQADILDSSSLNLEEFIRSKDPFVELFDMDTITLPLRAGFRKAGDKFYPLGFADEKKVGKFLTAQRISRDVRKNILIIRDKQKIIWVWPVRISEFCKITDSSRKFLRLAIKPR